MSQKVGNEFFMRYHYGTVPEATSPENMQRIGLALLAIVSADGFSEKEKYVYAELGRHMGVPNEIVEKMLATDAKGLDLAALLKGFTDGVPARAMLYDAIIVASADGYSEHERQAAARAAKILGIDTATLHAIEGLVEAESALRRMRAALLLPNGRFV